MNLSETLNLAIEAIDTGRPAAASQILQSLKEAVDTGRQDQFFLQYETNKNGLLQEAQFLALKIFQQQNMVQ